MILSFVISSGRFAVVLMNLPLWVDTSSFLSMSCPLVLLIKYVTRKVVCSPFTSTWGSRSLCTCMAHTFLYFWKVLSVISLSRFPFVSLQAPYTLWILGFVLEVMVVPKCVCLHFPLLHSMYSVPYRPVCMGLHASQCGPVPWPP